MDMPEVDFIRSPNISETTISDYTGTYSVEDNYIHYNGLQLDECPEMYPDSAINKIGTDLWFLDKDKNMVRYSLDSRKVLSTEPSTQTNVYKSLCSTYYIQKGTLYRDKEELYTGVTTRQLIYNTLLVKTPSYVYLINLTDDSILPVANRGFEVIKDKSSNAYNVFVNKHKVTSIVL